MSDEFDASALRPALLLLYPGFNLGPSNYTNLAEKLVIDARELSISLSVLLVGKYLF